MTEKETPLQLRLSNEEFYDFLTACRAKTKASIFYNIDECMLIRYLEFRGFILPPDMDFYQIEHTFKNVSLMRSREEILKDAARYHAVYIKRYATVIDSALKNREKQNHGCFELLEKEVKAILLQLEKMLKSERKYTNEAAFGFQYSLFFLHANIHKEIMEKVGDLLVEIKYNDIFNIADVIGRAKPQDALECNDVYALTRMTLESTIQYSDISRRFSLYITNFELLTTLSGHLTEKLYLNYINEQSVSIILDRVLNLVYNIAYHSNFQTRQKFDAIKKALINFPKVDKISREITIMMSLLDTMNENELCSLSDESNVIDTMIKYLKEALDKEDRRKEGFSLYELADGLSKLTLQTSNRSKIVHSEGALSALVNMLRSKNVKENTSAVRCIHALTQDNDVRSTLFVFPDLVAAMDDLRKTTSVKLRKIIEDILKTLQSCIPEVGVAAEPCLTAETSKPTQDIAMLGQSLPAAIHQLAVGVSQLKNSSPLENQGSSQPFVNFIVLDQSSNVTNVVQQEEKFTARGKSEKLRPEDEQTIRRHWTLLIEEIDATHIMMELISCGVFDVDDKREIVKHASRKKRTETMLQKLLNAGSGSAYAKFIDVLELNHKHVVEELKK